jgi:phosphoglucosamine mutase
LGAEVIPLAVAPDGFNINRDCGTTATAAMRHAVTAHGADLGLALDGDADRLLIADERGELLDGDQLLGLIAARWHRAGRLSGKAVVATVMSNLGLERYLKSLNLTLARTAVGDRYVAEEMRRRGCNLGGEQSGHIILGDHSTTGDGLIAALQVLAAIVETGAPASKVCGVFDPIPQLLVNVRVADAGLLQDARVKDAIDAGTRDLGESGRLLVRRSGTEPLIRIMAEGEDETLVAAVVDRVAATVRDVGGIAQRAAE